MKSNPECWFEIQLQSRHFFLILKYMSWVVQGDVSKLDSYIFNGYFPWSQALCVLISHSAGQFCPHFLLGYIAQM